MVDSIPTSSRSAHTYVQIWAWRGLLSPGDLWERTARYVDSQVCVNVAGHRVRNTRIYIEQAIASRQRLSKRLDLLKNKVGEAQSRRIGDDGNRRLLSCAQEKDSDSLDRLRSR
jgi:hypothetical protein